MRKIERRLRERLQDAIKLSDEKNEIICKMQLERNLFREHFANRFRWWIKLSGEQKSPNLAWLIEDDAKWLAKLETWDW